ncbi:sugar porter family MFS transporter [Acidisoma cladoniae]|jgi:SP family galactose:H+ symporter-like MFS transporter|uniref:sugar porter family MFS transporter n=1 Tax=Acidisoma cladoniae TaxID=3040935 RepID=UPI00254EC27C|nr:sugar porter family MFS transporter [Acidisoma sp. PAMC 29798]
MKVRIAAPEAPPIPAARPPSGAAQSAGQTVTPWLMVVLAVILFSGGLFGYDQGVISGALHGIKATFSLSALLVEVVTSWVTLGALFGALAGGELADRIGRKSTVLIAGAMFTGGALVQALAPDTVILVAGRLIVGGGVGVAAVAAPLYAAELAPTTLRGRFVSAYQLAITAGIFLAYLVDGWLSQGDAWRWMLGASAVPGLLLFAVALLAPESPRWLMKVGWRSEAAAQLQKIRPGVDFKPRLDAVAASLRREAGRASWAEVFHKEWRRPLLIGVGLAVFQQVTGINAIIYYADQIFASAGFTSQSSQTMVTTWAVGGVNMLATLIAIAFIDRLGRRKLLLAGLLGMGLSLCVVGIAFRFISTVPAGVAAAGPSGAGIVTLLALVAFIICFAFSMGPVVWTVINEIFPGHIRGRAVAVATAANWGSAFLVSQGFLSLIGVIGNSFTFWLFALFCGAGWVWIYRAVPETKGRSLEQIQDLWNGRGL